MGLSQYTSVAQLYDLQEPKGELLVQQGSDAGVDNPI